MDAILILSSYKPKTLMMAQYEHRRSVENNHKDRSTKTYQQHIPMLYPIPLYSNTDQFISRQTGDLPNKKTNDPINQLLWQLTKKES